VGSQECTKEADLEWVRKSGLFFMEGGFFRAIFI
jgi:hypothetical protein